MKIRIGFDRNFYISEYATAEIEVPEEKAKEWQIAFEIFEEAQDDIAKYIKDMYPELSLIDKDYAGS